MKKVWKIVAIATAATAVAAAATYAVRNRWWNFGRSGNHTGSTTTPPGSIH
jgi:hypothetical protein